MTKKDYDDIVQWNGFVLGVFYYEMIQLGVKVRGIDEFDVLDIYDTAKASEYMLDAGEMIENDLLGPH